MPPRRSHKKSRAGCRRCKNRKIKCDEVHPRCGNCAKHGVLCDFGNPDVLDELVASTTSSDSAGAPTPKPTTPPLQTPKTPSIRASYAASTSKLATAPMYTQPSLPVTTSLSGQVDRMMELRLMHQYTTVTAKTLLTNSPATEDIWQRAVPQMAFAKPYLMDAILSVAAFHLRSLTPDDKALVRASHAYSASTLAAYCASLNNGITPENAEALFLTAALIAFQAIASRIFIKDDADADPNDPTSRYALPLSWFHSFQGVKTVVAASWLWIRNSTAVKAVIESQPSFQLDLNPRSDHSFFGHLLEGLEEELVNDDPRVYNITAQAYSHAVCVVNWAHKKRYPAATLAFLATVSRRFVELVEAKRPRALAILACFFALLKRMDTWWLQDVSRREVMGLVGMFEPGSKWWRHLEWPVRIALWDGDTIPQDVWGTDWDTEPPQQEGSVQSMLHHIEMMADMFTQSSVIPPMAPPMAAPATPAPTAAPEDYLEAVSPD